jgi:hypothetical protein
MPNKAAKGFGSYSDLLQSQQDAQQQPYRGFERTAPEYVGTPKAEINLGSNQTSVEYDNRYQLASERLKKQLEEGVYTPEEYENIRVMSGIASFEKEQETTRKRRPRK